MFATDPEKKESTVIQKCALCLENRQLSESHIIPEYFYKPLYDEKHLSQVVRFGASKQEFQRKGWRESLLCASCEQFINGRYESYAARAWSSLFPGSDRGDAFVVHGLDFRRFTLFHLSVLWRASVSRMAFFGNVQLGIHEERIRRMLLGVDLGDNSSYRISASVSIYEDRPLHVITEPVFKNIAGHTVYLFRFGGCVWRYWISNHSPGILVAHPLAKEGELVLPKIRVEEDYQMLRILYGQ